MIRTILIILFILFNANLYSQSLTNELIGFWHFDNCDSNLSDNKLFDYHFTDGAVIRNNVGKHEQGLRLNGVKNAMVISTPDTLKTDYTLAYWLNPHELLEKEVLLFHTFVSDSTNTTFEVGINRNEFYFKYNEDTITKSTQNINVLKIENWNLFSYSIDSSGIDVSLNFKSLFSIPISTISYRLAINKQKFHIGANIKSYNGFEGYIDEVMFFNKKQNKKNFYKLKNHPDALYKKICFQKKIIIGSDTLVFAKNTKYFTENVEKIDTSNIIKIKVNNSNLLLKFWDSEKKDFDIIDIFSDDTLLVENAILRKRKQKLKYNLFASKNNYLFFHSIYPGKIALNTLNISIYELNLKGKKQKKIGVYPLFLEENESFIVQLYYEPSLEIGGLEYKMLKRESQLQRTIEVDTTELTLRIYDSNKEDNDIISVSLNGKFLLNWHSLKKDRSGYEIINLNLKPHSENDILFHSISTGNKGKNTLKVEVYKKGKKNNELFVSSDYNTNAVLKIITK